MKQPELLGLSAALVILAAVAAVAYRSIDGAASTLTLVEHTSTVLQQIGDVNAAYARATSARRAYVVVGEESQLAAAPELDARMTRAIATLGASIADDPPQLRRLDLLAPLLDERLHGLDASVARRRIEGAADETAEGLALVGRIRLLREEMVAEENRLLAERDARTRRDLRSTKLTEVIGTVASFAILLLAFWQMRREIGERREAVATLGKARDATEAANQELEAFSYSVAHDLRAPLRAIDGFSQALEEDCGDRLDAADRENLQRVRMSATEMGQLIDGLLGLSRLTRGELVREKVDLTRLAEQSVARLREAHPERRVDVRVASGLAAEGDPRLLTAALDNLVGNAWKFSSNATHAQIEVGRRVEDGHPAFFVRDNGAGFDPAYAHKLFGVFQRLHAATEFEGSGIGLATVRRIVQRHGGRIWAEGEVDRGATFYFTL